MSYPKAIATLLFAGMLVLYHHLSGDVVPIQSIEYERQMMEKVLKGANDE